MDREILFRGKTKDGRWMYGYLLKTEKVHNKNKKDGYFIITGAHHNGGWLMIHGRYPVIPETVGQFTGLCDKDGVKIYEGDIVFAGYGEYYQGTHEYSTTIIIDMADYEALNALCNANVVEVMGNIHKQGGD